MFLVVAWFDVDDIIAASLLLQGFATDGAE
jgi:hypothetical protein